MDDLPKAANLQSRIGFDDLPPGHAAGIAVVIRHPDLETDLLGRFEILPDILPSCFLLQVAFGLHEEFDPANADLGHFLKRNERAIMGAELDNPELGRRIHKPSVNGGPPLLFIRSDSRHPRQCRQRRQRNENLTLHGLLEKGS